MAHGSTFPLHRELWRRRSSRGRLPSLCAGNYQPICTATRVAPTDCRVHDRPLRHKRQYSNACCDDGRWLGRGRSCASSTPSEKPTFTRKQPVREPRPLVSTYASLPVVALAPTTRVRSISHLASPAGACLQVLTTCRSAVSLRASAAVRALSEPTMSIDCQG